jgi:hypothetical protein
MMTKKKQKNKKQKLNRKQYMLFAVVSTLVLLVLMIVYYAHSIWQNREDQIAQYKELQSRQVELLSAALEGKDQADMIEVLKSKVTASGENWAYLLLDGEMIFMRDENTTNSMSYYKTKDALTDYMNGSTGVYSSSSVADTGYVCGIYTTRAYILSNYGAGEFENYVILGFAAVFLAMGVMLIQYSVYLNRTLTERDNLARELQDRNKKFREYEKLSAGYREQLLDYEAQQRNGSEKRYDMEIVDALLSKSKDAELYPICFMYVSVIMADRYYARDELRPIMELIKSSMKKQHVTAELSKGFFAVLMYKTELAEAEKLRTVILKQWESLPDRKEDTRLRISLYSVTDEEDPKEAFYREKDKAVYEISTVQI